MRTSQYGTFQVNVSAGSYIVSASRAGFAPVQFGQKQWFPPGTPNPDWAPYPSGGALLAELGPDEYLLTGQRVRVNFAPAADRKVNGLSFASVEEGEYRAGKWTRSRIWNGDQTDYGLNLTDEPRVLRVRLATY